MSFLIVSLSAPNALHNHGPYGHLLKPRSGKSLPISHSFLQLETQRARFQFLSSWQTTRRLWSFPQLDAHVLKSDNRVMFPGSVDLKAKPRRRVFDDAGRPVDVFDGGKRVSLGA